MKNHASHEGMTRIVDTTQTDVVLKVRTWKSADQLALHFRNNDFHAIADDVATSHVREVTIRETRIIRLSSIVSPDKSVEMVADPRD